MSDRPSLRLLDRPGPSTDPRADARSLHPARGRIRLPVLYISGGPDDRIMFTRIARRWDGVKLLVTDRADEGLEMAKCRRPRMVVLDARLPDIDGGLLVTALRRCAPQRGLPIVVLGHDGSPGERARFVWAGANAYVTKPLHVTEIDVTVAELLEAPAG